MSNNEVTPTLYTREDLRILRISWHDSHLRRLEQSGKFPRRIAITKARVAWVKREVDEWLAALANRRA